ncbi:hypothetical protein NX059_009147 [Plenodomus lindquistii]|nr:hypothetical protein NX059_009147 [Plenodomus lindquistii]
MSQFRITQAPYSILFVQIACHYASHFLADYLPAWQVKLPFGYGFDLNLAPWSIKEHVLVTLTAASGATYNLACTPISMAELFYDMKINCGVAIFFMMAIVWVGYATQPLHEPCFYGSQRSPEQAREEADDHLLLVLDGYDVVAVLAGVHLPDDFVVGLSMLGSSE